MILSEAVLHGDADLPRHASIVDFWRWAFSNLCDDDIKGIFAEWMVGNLLGLPLSTSRRISWADSDLIIRPGVGVEIKASAVWQSWKLINPDGTPKPIPAPVVLNPKKVRFSGLQARSAVTPSVKDDSPKFKSDFYVFCMHTQTDPSLWNALDLSQWQFFLLSKQQLESAGVGQSISLAKLIAMQPPMSARQFQAHSRQLLF